MCKKRALESVKEKNTAGNTRGSRDEETLTLRKEEKEGTKEEEKDIV